MAEKKSAPKAAPHGAPIPGTFEPETLYSVTIKEDLRWHGVPLHANQTIVMTGEAAEEIRDGLATADIYTVDQPAP